MSTEFIKEAFSKDTPKENILAFFLKKGVNIIATDPCPMSKTGEAALTVGKHYKVYDLINKQSFYVTDDQGSPHRFSFANGNEFFKPEYITIDIDKLTEAIDKGFQGSHDKQEIFKNWCEENEFNICIDEVMYDKHMNYAAELSPNNWFEISNNSTLGVRVKFPMPDTEAGFKRIMDEIGDSWKK